LTTCFLSFHCFYSALFDQIVLGYSDLRIGSVVVVVVVAVAVKLKASAAERFEPNEEGDEP